MDMNHDYLALKIHQTRIHDLQTEARQDRVARGVLRARRVLARLTEPTSVLPLRPRERVASATGSQDGRHAA